MGAPMPPRCPWGFFLFIPFLFGVGSGRRGDPQRMLAPAPFTFFLSVQLEGPPPGMNSVGLAATIVRKLIEKNAPSFDLQAADGANDPCLGRIRCDIVTLVESISPDESASLQFVLRVQSGENSHRVVTVPFDYEMGCIWEPSERANWRRCPVDNAKRIIGELSKHLEKSH